MSGKDRGMRSKSKRIIGAVAAAGLLAGAAVTGASTAATAATGGVGWGTFGDTSTAYKGTFIQDGNVIICAEAGIAFPTNALRNAGLVDAAWMNANYTNAWGQHPNVTPNQVAGINRLMSEVGGTQDPNKGAAMEYAVRAVLYPAVADYNWIDQPMGSVSEAINWDFYSSAGSANVAAMQSYTTQYINLINSTTAGTGSTGSGVLTFTVDSTNNYSGTVMMDGTDGSTGSITLTNGIFVETGTDTLTNAVADTAYAVTGAAPDDNPTYKISGSGTFTAPGTSGYAPNVTAWLSNSGQQDSLGMGAKATNKPFTVSGEDPMVRSTVFSPIVHTTAKAFTQKGEKFHDVLKFSTVANPDGTTHAWAQKGANYAPPDGNRYCLRPVR